MKSLNPTSTLLPLASFLMGTFNDTVLCVDNCSGHGDCYNGTCFCEVQFSGGSCTDPNVNYFIAFSTIFYLISIISLVQLLLCIKAEFHRLKSPSLRRACQVTPQKLLYFLVFVATALRGYYFSSLDNALNQEWASSLLSAYYPVLLSGGSLVVCLWAEMFHLRERTVDSGPRFLSKSLLAFIIFNILTYSLLVAELVLLQTTANSSPHLKNLLILIFNGSYATLMLVVLIFFLIYGVEMYFKVRGQFAPEGELVTTDRSQLQQSRLGLLSHAILQLVTIGFLVSEVLGYQWKGKVPVTSRNLHHLSFRVVEMGLVLWFPCVLWNCISPAQLWILNPRLLFLRKPKSPATPPAVPGPSTSPTEADSLVTYDQQLDKLSADCWICYDAARTDMGPLIQPCNCKGDVSIVHHDCLKKWLIESSSNLDSLRCKVCKEPYQLAGAGDQVLLAQGLTTTSWIQSSAIVAVMAAVVTGSCFVVRVFTSVGLRVLAIGTALLVVYIGLRLLGFSMLTAYHRARFSAVRILNRTMQQTSPSVATIPMSSSCRLLDPQKPIIILKAQSSQGALSPTL